MAAEPDPTPPTTGLPTVPASSPQGGGAAASGDLARKIGAATLLLAASNLLSRVFGYARDWLINYQFGASGQTDVYQASFTVPDMLNHLLAGGALTISLLPRMSALYAAERNGPQPLGLEGLSPADRTFSVVFSAMIVAAVVLIVVCEVLAVPMVGALFSGFDAAKVAETAHLTRIVLPAQVFFLCGGLIQATLLARQSFRAMALTPLLYNGGIIAGGILGGRAGSIEGFSWGALVGAALGALLVPALSARKRLRFKFLWRPRDPELRAFLWTALPLMLGVSLTTVDEWLGRYFGSYLEAGSISWLAMARRVMLVPIGLLGVAAGQATGAYVARLYAEGRQTELAEVLARSLAAVLGLSLVLSAFLVAMAHPIVTMLFQYGKFTAEDATRTAGALVPLAFGIAAWGAQSVLARAFYGIGDTWRPMVATTVVTVAMLPVYALFGGSIEGLALAGTLGIAAQVGTLAVLARRRLGLDLRQLGNGVARALAVAVVAGLTAWAIDQAVANAPWLPKQPSLQALARLTAAGMGWATVVLGLGVALKMPGMPRQVERLLARLKR